MSVYKHQQGSYSSYRVARSVDGKLKQEYFPRTRQGLADAKRRDEELAQEQEKAQQYFSGPALRWQKQPKRVTKVATKTAVGKRSTKTSRKEANVSSKRPVAKRVSRAQASA